MIAGVRSAASGGSSKNIFRICPTTHERARARPMTPPTFRVSDPSELGNQLNPVSTKPGQFHSKTGAAYLPLYEAKMVQQYNHRYGDFADADGKRAHILPLIAVERLSNPS